jgi:hypothetical protein
MERRRHAIACNLANFRRSLALPEPDRAGSLTTLREKLVGARIVRLDRYAVIQLAEVAVRRALFAEILRRNDGLTPKPLPLLA